MSQSSKKCELCDKPIPAARIEAQPRTITCSREHAVALRRNKGRVYAACRRKQKREEKRDV